MVFVLDSSGSIGQSDWDIALEFVASIIEDLDPSNNDMQIGCVTYGNSAEVNFYLDTYSETQEMMDAVRRIRWKDQNTNTSAGIYEMHYTVLREARGKRSNAPSLGRHSFDLAYGACSA